MKVTNRTAGFRFELDGPVMGHCKPGVSEWPEDVAQALAKKYPHKVSVVAQLVEATTEPASEDAKDATVEETNAPEATPEHPAESFESEKATTEPASEAPQEQ